ncbi:protein of unknown function [Burkholderia multivorans]
MRVRSASSAAAAKNRRDRASPARRRPRPSPRCGAPCPAPCPVRSCQSPCSLNRRRGRTAHAARAGVVRPRVIFNPCGKFVKHSCIGGASAPIAGPLAPERTAGRHGRYVTSRCCYGAGTEHSGTRRRRARRPAP